MESIAFDEAANIFRRHTEGVRHVDRQIRRTSVSPVLAVHDPENAPSKKPILANVVRKSSPEITELREGASVEDGEENLRNVVYLRLTVKPVGQRCQPILQIFKIHWLQLRAGKRDGKGVKINSNRRPAKQLCLNQCGTRTTERVEDRRSRADPPLYDSSWDPRWVSTEIGAHAVERVL